MKSKILMSVLVIVVAISMVVSVTMAWFTDTETNSGNTFTAGTMDVDLNGSTNLINLGSIGNMAPGDVTDLATLEITNPGTLNLAWFGKLVITGDDSMKDKVYIDYMKMEFLKPDGSSWEASDEFIINGVGNPATYANTAFAGLKDATTGVITLRNWLGNNLMAPGSGYENMGALKHGYKYRLTFKLGFHNSAGNEYMGKSIDIAYKIDATQINATALDSLVTNGHNYVTWMNTQITNQN